MSSSRQQRFDEKVGPWGSRVRLVEDRLGGVVAMYFSSRSGSGYDREALDFTIRDEDGRLNKAAVEKARAEAQTLSKLLRSGKLPVESRAALTLGELGDAFRREQIPHKRPYRRSELRKGLAVWENYLGGDFVVQEFGRREWEAFLRQRQSGEIDARGRPVPPNERRRRVSPSVASGDLNTLGQVCRWARDWRMTDRSFLLNDDPTRGLARPRNQNPKRPSCSEERYGKLLDAADEIRIGHGEKKQRPALREILILAWHTGRRIGAILALKWGDWEADKGRYGQLHWRADSDKLGKDWHTPVTPEVREMLEARYNERLAQHGVPGNGDWIFPALEAQRRPVRGDVARGWLFKAEKKAGLDHPPGFGFHAFRRAWATRRKHLPAQDVARVGGWKNVGTLQEIYQAADPETMERVVMAGSKSGSEQE